jgi:TolB-like protein
MNDARILSAIMFTDIVGYTTMIGSDESMAIATVTRHKKIIQKEIVAFEGTLIQFYGDGSLSIFNSATSALKCALKIQHICNNEHQVPLRIGINIGEILIKEGSIYGEGVNIASRIESMGQKGTVLFSEEVFHKIRTNPQFKIKPLGAFNFKNVERPMNIHALANDGIVVPSVSNIKGTYNKVSSVGTKKQESSKSIAVLPFENNSSILEHQYFVDGVADEIRSQLLAISDLKVISRSSCMFYKDKPFTLSQIHEELNVKYVLEGRVQAAPPFIKVNVELSNTETKEQIWSLPPMDRKLEDIFSLQNEIAQQIVNELKIALTSKEKSQLQKISTVNQEAYKSFQLGQELLHRGYGKIDELTASREAFEHAVSQDPEFSKAYVGLSDTYLEHIFWGRIAPKEVLEPALKAALKALELDSSSGECYGALGAISFFKFQPKEASRFLRKAIDLSPNYLGAHEKLAWITIFDGNTEEAISLFDKAQALDPLSKKYMGDVGHAYYYSHRFIEGLEVITSFLKKQPVDPWLLWMKGYLLSGMQNYQMAIDTYLERPTGTKTNWMLGYNYGKIGELGKAEEILNFHLDKREESYVPAYMIATIYAGMADLDKALEWLETDFEDGGLGLFFYGLKTDPKFTELQGNSRFEKLLKVIQ